MDRGRLLRCRDKPLIMKKLSPGIFFIFLLLAFAQFVPARAAANAELEEIRRLETLLLTPCDKPLAYMTELVRLGQTYQDQE